MTNFFLDFFYMYSIIYQNSSIRFVINMYAMGLKNYWWWFWR
jgi:hypothetical protein